jgi:hypothetical protein
MTRDDIIRMAREANGYISELPNGDAWLFDDAALERFAALVAAAEREACAKVCDGWMHANGNDCAAAIRARGEA